MTYSSSLEDLFTGCLVGLATGDALGAPVETYHGVVPKRNLLEWQVTDDTEMALCLARSLTELGRFDAEDIGKRFVEWFYDNPIGAGKTTRAAITRLREGVPWELAGKTKKAATLSGNGSAMRCAPVALFDYTNDGKLIEHSIIQSSITHPQDRCTGSCVFVNTIIAGLLRGGDLDFAYHTGITTLTALGNQELIGRYQHIPLLKEINRSGEVMATVESAVYAVFSTGTYQDAVECAVAFGGDTDTRAAITGAVAGALYGERNVPLKWKNHLKDRNGFYIYEELKTLGLKLYELGNRPNIDETDQSPYHQDNHPTTP